MGDFGDNTHLEGTTEIYVFLHVSECSAPNGKPLREEDHTLPQGWEMRKTSEGRIYYVDHITRSTSWTPPQPYTEVEIVETRAGLAALPEGWEQSLDQNGRPYYIDHNNWTTSWVRPIPGVQETTRPLPQGWERRETNDGKARIYYVNHNDKSTSWQYPEHLMRNDTQRTSPSTSHFDATDLEDKDWVDLGSCQKPYDA